MSLYTCFSYSNSSAISFSNREQKEESEEGRESSSKSQKEDLNEQTEAKTPVGKLLNLLNQKNEGYEKEVRQLFEKQIQEMEIKTKTIDELQQKVALLSL